MSTPSGPPPPAPQAKVLLVDDDIGVVHTFFRMLKFLGYEVSIARDAEQGLQQLDASEFDVVLLDFRMPLVDGLAFLRRVRAHQSQSEIPVAVVTGDYFVDPAVVAELQALGASLHFKPLSIDDLVGIIQRLLEPEAKGTGDPAV